MYQNGCNAYRKSAANIVEDKQVIVLKLYDGVLKFLASARIGIAKKSPDIRGKSISKAMAIITELNCALDMDKGGKLAYQLDSLYRFVMDQLAIANRKNDLRALDQAENILVTLKEGFEGAFHQMKDANDAPQVIKETRTTQEGVCFAV